MYLVATGVVRITDDTVRLLADLIADRAEIRHEAIPLRRNAGVGAIPLSKPEDQQRVFARHTCGSDRGGGVVVDSDWTHELDSFHVAPRAELLGRHAKLLPECTRERFVRSITAVERHAEDVGCAAGQRTSRLAEPTAPYVRRQCASDSRAKRPRQVESRHLDRVRDGVE